MDRKSLIALILIGAIFLLWPTYMKKVAGVKPAPTSEQPATEIVTPMDESSPVAETSREPAAVLTRREIPERTPVQAQLENAETYVVETNRFKGEISSLGGGTLLSWRLKEFQRGAMDGEMVELIPDSASGDLALVSEYRGLNLDGEIFKTVQDSQFVEDGKNVRVLRFVYGVSENAWVEKAFRFTDDSYDIDMDVRFVGLTRDQVGDNFMLQWNSGLYPTERNLNDDLFYYQAYALQGDEVLKTKEKNTGLCEGTTRWVAVRSKYFVMAIVPETQGSGARLEGQKKRIYYNGEFHDKWKTFQALLMMPFRGGADETSRYKVYLGPIDYKTLKKRDAGLEKLMNFGWAIIRPFSIAFMHVLEFLHDRVVHNYGWAIIIFAIMIKIVLYPLTRKSFQSIRAMQELQPKITALREKHKNDPQKLNQATMELYKKEGVNPMGGCLPMLLQMPVLFALFNLFRTTIMLRQSHFGPIVDLSAPDGIIMGVNILPILMTVTMIIQQRLTNRSQDTQQKMMAFMMPIMMAFIFYRLSAGLNLYYLMFNVLTIAQEYYIKRKK